MNLTFKEGEMFITEALKSLGASEFKRIGDNDIACKCPICGDSQYGNKKRLHYYEKNGVINVNCFNGDCPAKNLTAYRFLQTFAPRIFNKFREYQRRKWFQQLIGNTKKSKELETISMDDDIGGDGESGKLFESLQETGKTQKPKNSKEFLGFIDKFKPQSLESGWVEIMKFLSQNPQCQGEFKELLSP